MDEEHGVNAEFVCWISSPITPGRTSDSCWLHYCRAAPFEVVLQFLEDGGTGAWVLPRSLIHEGLSQPAGEGTIRVMPSKDLYTGEPTVEFWLTGPMKGLAPGTEGAMILTFYKEGLSRFVAMTEEYLPLGEEPIVMPEPGDSND